MTIQVINEENVEEIIFLPIEHSLQEDKTDPLQTLQELLEALADAQIEQEKLFAKKKETKEKSLEKNVEIEKKDKDITIIIDDEESKEKLKDKFMDGVLSITIDMDGFAKFHLRQYQQQRANYFRFLAEYLNEGMGNGQKVNQYSYTATGEKQEEAKTEVQMLSHAEKQDYVRATVMNNLLGTGTNYVNPHIKENWELWRIFQHNQILSFLYTSEWRH